MRYEARTIDGSVIYRANTLGRIGDLIYKHSKNGRLPDIAYSYNNTPNERYPFSVWHSEGCMFVDYPCKDMTEVLEQIQKNSKK